MLMSLTFILLLLDVVVFIIIIMLGMTFAYTSSELPLIQVSFFSMVSIFELSVLDLLANYCEGVSNT